jgi:hypothetical protein
MLSASRVRSDAEELLDEDREERESQLLDMMASDGFRRVLLPALKERQAKVLKMLATTHGTIDQIRELQGAYKLLCELVENTKGFALGKRE